MAAFDSQRLGDFFRIKHGYAFKGEFFSDSGAFILLTPGNFEARGGLKLKGDKEKYYTGEIPEDFVLRQGDLIVAMTDLTQNAPILGAPAFIPTDGRFLHNQRLGKIVDVNTDRLNIRYLFYLFNLPEVRSQIKSTATGATVRHTAPDRIYEVRAPLPAPEIQLRIADVLSAYDDLIENNTKRIKILEEMARSLYREWFVLFRYPGHEKTPLIDSPLGKVPQSWRVGPLENVVSLQRGFDITKTQQREGAYSVISSSGPGSTHDEYKVPGPGVIIGRKGTLGTVFFSEDPYWPHDTTLWVTDFHGHGPRYCFQLLRALRLEQYDCGASNPTINRNHIHKILVAIPPHTLTVEYDRIAAEFMRLSRLLQDESAVLRRTRDLLLPRLLSGEIELHP